MRNIKTPMGTVKKGMAHFGRINGTTTTISQYGAIPFGERTVFNDSNNIFLPSTSQITLKKGCKYKLTGQLCAVNSNTSDLAYQFYNVTTSSYVGISGLNVPITNLANVVYSATPELIIITEVDTTIELRYTSANSLTQIIWGTSVIVEELEAYLIPTDPTKYTDVINYTSASGSVLIPSGLPVGTKKLIRKLNSSQGTVTITCTGETFTSSNLSSVTLNADGDFWLVEKVNATRWDLVDGKESGSNANGEYICKPDGTIFIKAAYVGGLTLSVYSTGLYSANTSLTLPRTCYGGFFGGYVGRSVDNSNTGWAQVQQITSTTYSLNYFTKSAATTTTDFRISFDIRWY